MADTIKLINNYMTQMELYVSRVTNRNYWIELTKCCGYGEILAFYRDYTLSEFYVAVKQQMVCPDNTVLYILDDQGSRMIIPDDPTITLSQFIRQHIDLFQPIYPLPAKVVYRIYLDDGHIHECSIPNA